VWGLVTHLGASGIRGEPEGKEGGVKLVAIKILGVEHLTEHLRVATFVTRS